MSAVPSATRQNLSELPMATRAPIRYGARKAAMSGEPCERLSTTVSGRPGAAGVATSRAVMPSRRRQLPCPAAPKYVTPRPDACTTPATGTPSWMSAMFTV